MPVDTYAPHQTPLSRSKSCCKKRAIAEAVRARNVQREALKMLAAVRAAHDRIVAGRAVGAEDLQGDVATLLPKALEQQG